MKLVKEHINEKFEEESDPIEDLSIGLILCPVCGGIGWYSDHDPNSIDWETGEHDCSGCPIAVECHYCEGTGYNKKSKYKEYKSKDAHEEIDLPF